MPPSLRIRRLCARLHFLADLLEKVRGAPASPPAVEECIVELEASAMLLEHQLSDRPAVTATLIPIRPFHKRRAILLRFPPPAEDSAPDATGQENTPSADVSP
jgi:hypothetical protein